MDSNYKKIFKDYQFRIEWTSSKPFNPEREAVDVVLTTKEGKEYYANVATPRFINYVFEKNKRTGECASGSYFCMPRLIIVKRIDKETIKATIDDLINNLEVKEYFKKT
ncbi:hypothetical protein J4409_00590 [Candidatus Woesearchaeota archaeon]|nr:hypothetical protein [Candidatus Woesearchaeota archaeon]